MPRIFTARDSLEANFVKSLLDQAGIEAVIEGELIQQIRGDIPLTMETLPKIVVRDSDLAATQTIIDEFRARKTHPTRSAGERWLCICGEKHNNQFTSCWRCGAVKPDPLP